MPYQVRACLVCGATFQPEGPRWRRCPNCRSACADCGKPMSDSLRRKIANPIRRCMECHRKTDLPIGSKRPHSEGYIEIKAEAGWMFEHRYMMEQYLGRKLTRAEQVHHKDEDRTHNEISNFVLEPNLRAHLDNHHRDKIAKLTPAQVQRIRESAASKPYHLIALEMGIDNGRVSRICRGELWKNAPGPIWPRKRAPRKEGAA